MGRQTAKSVPNSRRGKLAAQELLDQSEAYIRRLHLENLSHSLLDRSVASQEAALIERKAKLRAMQKVARQRALLASLSAELALRQTHLSELRTDNARLRSEVDSRRRDLLRERQFLADTETALAEVRQRSQTVHESLTQGQRQVDAYTDRILQVAATDRSARTFSHPASSESPSPRSKKKPTLSVSLAKGTFEPPRTDLLRSLVAKWREKVETQREVVQRYQLYIADVTEGFAVVKDSTPAKTAEEFIAWMNKERVLKEHLNLVLDEIAELESVVTGNRRAISRLSEASGTEDEGEGGVTLVAAPLLSAVVRKRKKATQFRSSQYIDHLRELVAAHCEEVGRNKALLTIAIGSTHDYLRQAEQPLAELKAALDLAGLNSTRVWGDFAFTLGAFMDKVLALESAVQRLAELLGRPLPPVNPRAAANSGTHSLAPAIPDTVDAHYPLSHDEFRQRAADRLAFHLP